MQRCRLIVAQVTAPLHVARRAAGNNDRQVGVIVEVGIPHPTAIQIQNVVQERSNALGRVFQLLQKLGKQRYMELVDACHLGHLIRIIAMMSQRVMRFVDANFGISAIAGLCAS